MFFAVSKLGAAADGAVEEGAAEDAGAAGALEDEAPQPANAVNAIAEIKAADTNFFILNKLLYSCVLFFVFLDCLYIKKST